MEYTQDAALKEMAEDCAWFRLKGICKNKFGAPICDKCDHFIGNYGHWEPGQMKLFMFVADSNMAEFKVKAEQAKRNINARAAKKAGKRILLALLAVAGIVLFVQCLQVGLPNSPLWN